MLAKIRNFNYFEPSSLSEAISLLDEYDITAKLLAGGTDLLINMKQRFVAPDYIINIKSIPELDYIRYDKKEGLKIGALVTHSALAGSEIVKEKYLPLVEACLAVGSPEIRNRGTIAGNICNASPSADTPPALMALDAKLKLASVKGERIVDIDKFFAGPFSNLMEENELLTEIQIPMVPSNSGGSFLWLPKVITSVDETLVGVGAVITLDHTADKTCREAKIALCSVAPTPIRAKETEKFLKNKKVDADIIVQAGEIASEEASPRSRPEYRREMIKVIVKRALNLAMERIS